MAIYIFYHIFCNNYTNTIVKDQIDKIIFSRLYKKTKKIYYFLLGSDEERANTNAFIKTYVQKFKIPQLTNKFVLAAENEDRDKKLYERFTLLSIFDYIKPNDKLLYIHTKGVTKPYDYGDYDWRCYMEYFTICKWRECIQLLDSYDLVSANYVDNPGEEHKPHFSGNIWWSRGSHYLRLPREIDDNFVSPEFHVCKCDPSIYCIHSLRSMVERIPCYGKPYPFSLFIDEKRPYSSESPTGAAAASTEKN